MNTKQIEGATGRDDRDYLVVENQWAKLEVERHLDKWRVTGRDGDGSAWSSASKALGHAMDILADYARGALR